MKIDRRPFVLIILDGWGHTDNTNYNAIYSAKKPIWENLWGRYPHKLINASGLDVGLPSEQMGNSEVGHMSIGAGRIVKQEFTHISDTIRDGSFFDNAILKDAFSKTAAEHRAVHLMGLLSQGGVHSHEDHIFALIEMAQQCGVDNLYLHAFLDGRDTAPKSAIYSVQRASEKLKIIKNGRFASLIGRYYAMDRNQHWDRTKKAYDLFSQGKAKFHSIDPFIALDMAYARGESDEFIEPTTILQEDQLPISIADGDLVIFANYRADRARQLARAFTKKDFKSFYRERFPLLKNFISLTEYKANYEFPVAFPPEHLDNVLGEYISKLNLRQLRIAETEKYAHITFFFNGGQEQVFDGEDRILVPSSRISTYDKLPQMSAFEITERLIEAVSEKKYDAIICNFANADMVGHTGNFDATIKAIETIDSCLGRIVPKALSVGGELLITADHGNAEQLRAYTSEKVLSDKHTAHTSNLVPFLYVGRSAKASLGVGALSDVAPTMLSLMGIAQPTEMTGSPQFWLSD